MFDTIAGLPVHVLVVHGAVVLIPLSAVGAVLIVLRPRLLRLFGFATVIAAGVGTVASVIAKESGQELAGRVGWPEQHVSYGNLFPFAAIVFFIGLSIYWLFARGIPLNRPRPRWLAVFGIGVILAAIGMSYFTLITGHTGSEAVWSQVTENTRPGTFQQGQ